MKTLVAKFNKDDLKTLNSNTVLTQLWNELAFNIMRQQEKLIEKAIERYTKEPYDFKQIENRLSMEVIASVGVFYMDGNPIIEFYPPKIERDNQEMVVSQQYRMFF